MRQFRTEPDIIAIGASAGGVAAAVQLIQRLPRNLPGAVLLVIHRSPFLVSKLPEIVKARAKMKVELAEEGSSLHHGVCLVAPVDQHIIVGRDTRIHLLPDSSYRARNIDVLFNSLAQAAGSRTIGVILSGTLRDGCLGLLALKEAGGIALVQEPAEAEFPDMPRNAIAGDGPVDFIGPVELLAREICIRLGCSNLSLAL